VGARTRSLPGLNTPAGLGLAVASLAVGTAVLYAIDVFGYSGGVVFVPFHAAVVGALAALVVGTRRRWYGVALAVAYAPFLGARLEWGLVELSTRPLVDRLAFVVRPGSLGSLAVEAAVVGTVGYGVGRTVRWLVDRRDRPPVAE